MLLIADANRTGVVDMPVERLAARAGMSVEETISALQILASPDPDSRSEKEGGRRILPLRPDSSRGWLLVNWEDYKAIASEEQQREGTRKRVADYRGRQAPIQLDDSGYVYYVGEPDGDRIKIGYSRNPWARLTELRTASPALQILATERGPAELEFARHAQFADQRLEREWFTLSEGLAEHIRSLSVTTTTTVVTVGDVGNTSEALSTSYSPPSSTAESLSPEGALRKIGVSRFTDSQLRYLEDQGTRHGEALITLIAQHASTIQTADRPLALLRKLVADHLVNRNRRRQVSADEVHEYESRLKNGWFHDTASKEQAQAWLDMMYREYSDNCSLAPTLEEFCASHEQGEPS